MAKFGQTPLTQSIAGIVGTINQNLMKQRSIMEEFMRAEQGGRNVAARNENAAIGSRTVPQRINTGFLPPPSPRSPFVLRPPQSVTLPISQIRPSRPEIVASEQGRLPLGIPTGGPGEARAAMGRSPGLVPRPMGPRSPFVLRPPNLQSPVVPPILKATGGPGGNPTAGFASLFGALGNVAGKIPFGGLGGLQTGVRPLPMGYQAGVGRKAQEAIIKERDQDIATTINMYSRAYDPTASLERKAKNIRDAIHQIHESYGPEVLDTLAVRLFQALEEAEPDVMSRRELSDTVRESADMYMETDAEKLARQPEASADALGDTLSLGEDVGREREAQEEWVGKTTLKEAQSMYPSGQMAQVTKIVDSLPYGDAAKEFVVTRLNEEVVPYYNLLRIAGNTEESLEDFLGRYLDKEDNTLKKISEEEFGKAARTVYEDPRLRASVIDSDAFRNLTDQVITAWTGLHAPIQQKHNIRRFTREALGKYDEMVEGQLGKIGQVGAADQNEVFSEVDREGTGGGVLGRVPGGRFDSILNAPAGISDEVRRAVINKKVDAALAAGGDWTKVSR
jgi:hypothetical protein